MEVLRPTMVHIGNRCYRKSNVQSRADLPYDDPEEDNFGTGDLGDYADESCTADYEADIKSTSKGYQLELCIPSNFHKHIIGKKGETKKRIETETRTQIRVPRQQEDGDVVIIGAEKSGVRSARTRIEVLMTTARRRMPFTHFLSFPVGDKSIHAKLEEFKQLVLQTCGKDRGIDRTIFQNPSKLHITVGTMVLLDEQEIQKAKEVIEQYQHELFSTILKNEPLTMEIRGLEYMNDDPSAVDVLYAKVSLTDKSDRLQKFADSIVNRFVSAGIMDREYERVKLHITVMNSLMRKDPSGTTVIQTDQQRIRESFDAVNVLKLYGDYKFGDYQLDSLHISQRFSTSPDAYYSSAATFPLPS